MNYHPENHTSLLKSIQQKMFKTISDLFSRFIDTTKTMPVTEIALLRMKRIPLTHFDAYPWQEAPDTLLTAIAKQTTFSKYPVMLLQCLKVHDHVYLVGGWDSIERHMNEWIPGLVNQELLKSLEEDVEVKYMFHLDCEPNKARELIGDGVRGCMVRRWKVEKGKIVTDAADGVVIGTRLDQGFEAEGGAQWEQAKFDEQIGIQVVVPDNGAYGPVSRNPHPEIEVKEIQQCRLWASSNDQ